MTSIPLFQTTFDLTFDQPRVFVIFQLPKGYTCTLCLFTFFCLEKEEYLAKSDCLYFLLPNRNLLAAFCVVVSLNIAIYERWKIRLQIAFTYTTLNFWVL